MITIPKLFCRNHVTRRSHGFTGDKIVQKRKNVVIIGNNANSLWVTAVRDALANWGTVQFQPECEALANPQEKSPDLFLVDASTLETDTVQFVASLNQANPCTPIIVATTSPTWRRARDLIQAGATDYVRRSFNKELILDRCQASFATNDPPEAEWNFLPCLQ